MTEVLNSRFTKSFTILKVYIKNSKTFYNCNIDLSKRLDKKHITAEERWQYPMDALREIVINMIVHRDYMHYGDSSVKIYDDYIEFFNPGRLSENISVEQLLSGDYSSQARNRKIASAFKEAQLIEKYGSGIKRIMEGFANYGLRLPLFENFQHGFRVIVYAQDAEPIEETVGETVGIKNFINKKQY